MSLRPPSDRELDMGTGWPVTLVVSGILPVVFREECNPDGWHGGNARQPGWAGLWPRLALRARRPLI
jgi:hypothetical protein